uniref:MFS transporter n=1 Tax=Rhodococcus opacus TaxID=37919 RepID=UPI0037C61B72
MFGPLFFPSFSSIAGTLAAFATFSVGFIARPSGGVVMGHFGDRIGRKSMLVLSLMLMGGATVGIGLLPTYATIGVWAPILLVTLRFVQGIGDGGEWGGAVLMAVEHAPANRKGFYGSFPQMGVPGGLILANLVFLGVSTSLSEEAFLSWGWRVPFLASAVTVLMGLVIRFTITESPDFEKVKSTHRDQRLPIVTVLRENLREVLLAAGAFIGINTVGYIFMAYLLSYSTKVLGMSKTLPRHGLGGVDRLGGRAVPADRPREPGGDDARPPRHGGVHGHRLRTDRGTVHRIVQCRGRVQRCVARLPDRFAPPRSADTIDALVAAAPPAGAAATSLRARPLRSG